VQKKWKYLRDYFREEHVKKIPQPRSDASNNVTPSWPYYKQLLFLKDHIKNRVSQGDLQITQPDIETTDSCSESFVVDKPLCSETPKVCVSPENEPRVSVPQRAHKRPNALLGEALLNVEQQKLDYLKQKHSRKLHEFDSEDVSFFQSLLPHVAKIPPERKLLFRCKVQEMVQQFAYEIPQNYPTYTNTPSPEFTQNANVPFPQSTETVLAVPVKFETEVTGYAAH
jgi:hypothetical protein